MLLLSLFACGAEAPTPDPHAGHAAEVAPASPAPSLHASHSDHMKMMAATRERLRAELGPAYDAPVPGLAAADAGAGRATFEQQCASCHGATGKGDGPAGKDLNPPPSDMTDAFHARYYSDAGRVQVIRRGSPGTAMAGFEGALSEEQIVQVYAFVASLRPAVTP